MHIICLRRDCRDAQLSSGGAHPARRRVRPPAGHWGLYHIRSDWLHARKLLFNIKAACPHAPCCFRMTSYSVPDHVSAGTDALGL